MSGAEKNPAAPRVLRSEDVLRRAREVIDIEIEGLNTLRGNLGESFVQLVSCCLDVLERGGKLVVSGVGKSGHIGHKLAATLASTGSRSVFMHPVEAMHGDLGILAAEDLLLAVSYSGETDEMLALLPSAKRIGAAVVAITGNPQSQLARWSDLVEFVKPVNPVNPEDGDKLYLGLLKGIPFHWESRNIQATSEYGVGFLRVPGLSGGWYDNSINLSDYYEDKLTVAGIVASPLLSVAVRYTDFDPESEAENPPRKTTTVIEEVGDAGVSPNGIVLSLTFAKEIGIGLAAPKADTPKKDPGTGEYNYDLVNPTGLTLSFTRATGIFKGGFNVYYDYISAENSTLDVPTQTYSHVIKKALYEGVLTPVRNPTDSDNRGGRGFYLWPGKSTYEKVDKFGEPLVDKNGNPILIPYSFNWSYDFLINNGN